MAIHGTSINPPLKIHPFFEYFKVIRDFTSQLIHICILFVNDNSHLAHVNQKEFKCKFHSANDRINGHKHPLLNPNTKFVRRQTAIHNCNNHTNNIH